MPPHGNTESRALSHAFGLLALGKFILRLPTEILEDELPRLQLTLSQVSTYSYYGSYVYTL